MLLVTVLLAGCSSDPGPVVVRTSTPSTPAPPASGSGPDSPPGSAEPTGSAPTGSPTANEPAPGGPASSAPVAGQVGDLGKPATVSGVTVQLTDVRSVTAAGGPAVSVTVDVRNGRAQGVSLGGAQVRLEHAGTTIEPDPSSVPVPAAVGAGQTVQGTYVFVLAPDARDQVTVTVSSSLSGPLTFTGAAPAA